MNIIKYMFSIVLSCFTVWYFLPKIFKLLKDKGRTADNYRGRPVVTCMGLIFVFPCMFSVVPYMTCGIDLDHLAFLAVTASLTLVGMVDDVFGDGTIKGIKGHVMVILKGGLSTGGIKLIISTLIGMFVSFYHYTNIVYWGVYTLLLLLFINFINLMDLRPGRAIKAFVFSILILMPLSGFASLWVVIPVLSAIPFYLKGEMKEKYMLGDTGANLLGGIAGFYAVKTTPLIAAFIIMAVLLAVQVIAEYYSLSKFIESVPVLRFIDGLWRLKRDGDASTDRA